MTCAAFEKVNRRQAEAGEKPFINPRTTAAGAVRQLDPKITPQRPLSFSAHGFGVIRGWRRPARHSEGLDRLEALGPPRGSKRAGGRGGQALGEHHAPLREKRGKLPLDN